MPLDPHQLQTFHTAGYLKLPQAVPANDIEAMQTRVWSLLADKGILRDAPETWGSDQRHPRGLNLVSGLQQLKDGESSPDHNATVSAALDAVFDGSRRRAVRNWGQVLVTLPTRADHWLVPRDIWHFDHFHQVPGKISGVNIFLLMGDVAPGGGGTAVVRNSPQLLNRLLETGTRFRKIAELNRRFVEGHSWLQGLKVPEADWHEHRNNLYINRDTDVHGIPVRVEQLTGNAGDVYICHPALLHAPAMNVSDEPRLMRTQRIYDSGLA